MKTKYLHKNTLPDSITPLKQPKLPFKTYEHNMMSACPLTKTNGDSSVSTSMWGSHLWEAVLGEHVKQGGLPTLAVPHHHDLTLHALARIHAGLQGGHRTAASVLHGGSPAGPGRVGKRRQKLCPLVS